MGSSSASQRQLQLQPKSRVTACLSCRLKKIRCDIGQPRCSACSVQGRECQYRKETPRKRPTFAKLDILQQENTALRAFIARLKESSADQRESLLTAAVSARGVVHVDCQSELSVSRTTCEKQTPSTKGSGGNTEGGTSKCSEDKVDIGNFISLDEKGKPRSFGPSSSLYIPSHPTRPQHEATQPPENRRNRLIANAALQRQLEHGIRSKFADVHGVRADVALQLLDLHWKRQHHTFLLTYRPAIMRDLLNGGTYSSPFLLNSIFAGASKYSDLLEIRHDPTDPSTAGQCFFRRCDVLLAEASLLVRPAIPTIIGLLLLGSSYISRCETSKGWLYTGYALRMVYDLGLHLDPEKTTKDPEEIEIRRRVFWGAFVCDKLQSLYLGRPVAINLRDFHVSMDLYDTYEENERYGPRSCTSPMGCQGQDTVIHSVTVFRQLCLLSKIIAEIINRFYVVGTTVSDAQSNLQQVDFALEQWKQNLPPDLNFESWVAEGPRGPGPNAMLLHSLYHSLVILLHRPFISDGHLRSAVPLPSWERCTAAAQSITRISEAYKTEFGAANGPYLLGYSVYVACTIHVRNATSQSQSQSQSQRAQEHLSMLKLGLDCLDELCLPNPGVAKPVRIIRKLAEVNNLRLDLDETQVLEQFAPDFNIDMDAILNTFPTSNEWDGGVLGLDDELDANATFDPLFGIMDPSSAFFAGGNPTA